MSWKANRKRSSGTSTDPIQSGAGFRVVGDADELLADVAPVEEPDERPGRALEPVGDVLDVGERAVPDVGEHPRLVLGGTGACGRAR